MTLHAPRDTHLHITPRQVSLSWYRMDSHDYKLFTQGSREGDIPIQAIKVNCLRMLHSYHPLFQIYGGKSYGEPYGKPLGKNLSQNMA
jgi:hypothetical protein